MKTNIKHYLNIIAVTSIGLTLMGTGQLLADEKDPADQKHEAAEEKMKAGPNGGKILHSVEPHVEFFVTKDRKIQFTALSEDGKAIPIAGQSISIIGGSRANPTRISFKKEGDILVSDIAVPEGNMLPLVIQIKTTPESKTVIEKFNLNLSDCPTCDYLEYACICGHDEESHVDQ